MNLTHRVVAGTAQLTISNGIVRLLSLVTMPVLTGLLSPHTYGVAALISTVISLCSVLALAGIDTTYLRTYHSNQPPSGPDAEQFCWRFSILNALLTAALVGIAWRFFSGPSIDPDHEFAILVPAGVILSVLSTMAQGRALVIGRHRILAVAIAA